MAHALTAVRLLLVVPFALAMAGATARHAAWAAVLLAVAIATDVLDGLVARRRRTASAAGRLFDHATDMLFVTSGLAAGATRGAFPWILPVLVAAAFAQYVIDSYAVSRGRQLRPSHLGRYNGILYFVPLGGDVLVHLGGVPLERAVTAFAWLLVASTLVSMAGRLLVAVTGWRRRGSGSLAAGRGAPPRR